VQLSFFSCQQDFTKHKKASPAAGGIPFFSLNYDTEISSQIIINCLIREFSFAAAGGLAVILHAGRVTLVATIGEQGRVPIFPDFAVGVFVLEFTGGFAKALVTVLGTFGACNT